MQHRTHFFCAFNSAMRPDTVLGDTAAVFRTLSLGARTREGLARRQVPLTAVLQLDRACMAVRVMKSSL